MLRLFLLYQFWLGKICICHKPSPTRDETHDQQIALPKMLMLLFFSILPVLHTPKTLALVLNLEVGHFARHFLLLSFWCCYERNSIHIVSLSHFISLVCSAHHQFFLSSQGQLLDSRKRRLFCLHIQHTTCCLFKRLTPVGSSEAAVCGFCLSISLHKFISHSNELGKNPWRKSHYKFQQFFLWLIKLQKHTQKKKLKLIKYKLLTRIN